MIEQSPPATFRSNSASTHARDWASRTTPATDSVLHRNAATPSGPSPRRRVPAAGSFRVPHPHSTRPVGRAGVRVVSDPRRNVPIPASNQAPPSQARNPPNETSAPGFPLRRQDAANTPASANPCAGMNRPSWNLPDSRPDRESPDSPEEKSQSEGVLRRGFFGYPSTCESGDSRSTAGKSVILTSFTP